MPQKLLPLAEFFSVEVVKQNEPVLVVFCKFDGCLTFPSTTNTLQHKYWTIVLFPLRDQMLFHVVQERLASCEKRVGSAWHVPMCIAWNPLLLAVARNLILVYENQRSSHLVLWIIASRHSHETSLIR